MPIRQITIVGTGLIGGSLGLALRKRKFTGRIVGCDRAPVLTRARDIGAIDEGFTNPADAVRGSHVVVLATPVIAIIDLIERLGPCAFSARASDRCGQHQTRDREHRPEGDGQECGAAVSGGTSDGGEGTVGRGLRGCRTIFRCGMVFDTVA